MNRTGRLVRYLITKIRKHLHVLAEEPSLSLSQQNDFFLSYFPSRRWHRICIVCLSVDGFKTSTRAAILDSGKALKKRRIDPGDVLLLVFYYFFSKIFLDASGFLTGNKPK
ncbi:hypothetical protein CEXT_185891 [Caerostris extrusa]|uniref:Uncharacterized protein n=1 Tax=Caerostris extrusa TaxID=172846 RepID=A0AAV4MGB8_CAEEX|nr:hypothetical protein CEXT_185891 [Caerostris extrusa]